MEMIFTEEDLLQLFCAIRKGDVCGRVAEPCEKYRDKNGFLDCSRCIGEYLQALLEDQEYGSIKLIIDEGKEHDKINEK